MDETIDITGIDQVKLIQALYLGTRALGMGMLHDQPDGLTDEQARDALVIAPEYPGGRKSFDYVYGRPFKLFISPTVLSGVRLYDRDAGQGACKRAVDQARKAG